MMKSSMKIQDRSIKDKLENISFPLEQDVWHALTHEHLVQVLMLDGLFQSYALSFKIII